MVRPNPLSPEVRDRREGMAMLSLIHLGLPAMAASVALGISFGLFEPVSWLFAALPAVSPWAFIAVLFRFTPILDEPWNEGWHRVWFWPLLFGATQFSWATAWASTPAALMTVRGAPRLDLLWSDAGRVIALMAFQAVFLALRARAESRKKTG
jgi:hypothetical protein